MNLYFLGILAALVVFFAVGIGAGRMVKDTNDYYVSGRNAPTLLIVGSLIASFLSTGAFLGDTGEVYSGFFIGIVTVGVIQATGYIYGAGFFGRYIRRSEVTTLPEYFGCRFCSKHLRRLSAVILLVSVSAYLLSAIQGVATLMSSITGYDYRLCAVIVWLAFTAFTIYSGSPGVLLTDTIMFLVFLAAALVAVPFLIRAGGGWFAGNTALTADTVIADDTTYTAAWTANTYTVQYLPNGGTGEMAAQTFTYDAEQALTANAFTRAGYDFRGWDRQQRAVYRRRGRQEPERGEQRCREALRRLGRSAGAGDGVSQRRLRADRAHRRCGL